jgi:hypothetical protein
MTTVMTMVIPKAMIAAGYNQSLEVANAFFFAYAQAWQEMQATVLPALEQAPPPEPSEAQAVEVPPPKARRRKRASVNQAEKQEQVTNVEEERAGIER